MQSPVSKTVVSITQLDKLFLVFTILLGLLKSPVVTYVRALTTDAKQCQNAEAKSEAKTEMEAEVHARTSRLQPYV